MKSSFKLLLPIRKPRSLFALTVFILLVLAIVVFLPGLQANPLLDEQFLLNFVKAASSQALVAKKLFSFSGIDSRDLWQPITSLSYLVCGSAAFSNKLFNFVLHLLCSVLVYSLGIRIIHSRLIALCASAIFCFYPLNMESVSWIGGRGQVLFCFFFLLAMYLLLTSVPATIKVDGSGQVDKKRLVCAFFVMALGLYSALPSFDASLSGNIVLSIYGQLKQLLFPLGPSYPKIHREYNFLYMLMAPLVISVPFAMFLNRRYCRLIIVFFITTLLFLSGFSVVHTDSLGTNLFYGSHFLYAVSAFYSLFITLSFFSFSYLSKEHAKLTRILSLVFVLLFVGFEVKHLYHNNVAYRSKGKLLRKIQANIKAEATKNNMTSVIVQNIPQGLSIYPSYQSQQAQYFDSTTGLMQASSIPVFVLKQMARDEQYSSRLYRWDDNFSMLMKWETNPRKSAFGNDLTAAGFVERLDPPLTYLKDLVLDQSTNLLMIDGPAEHCPALSLNGFNFSPVDGDLFWVDCMIQAPENCEHKKLDLYWLNAMQHSYDPKYHHSSAEAIINDQQFHRYYLPLTALTWTAEGQIMLVTLGFPTGAKVAVKNAGVICADEFFPHLSIKTELLKQGELSSNYVCPYFSYPNDASLAMFCVDTVSNTEVPLSLTIFNRDFMEKPSSVMFELSEANATFENPNGSQLDSQASRHIQFKMKDLSVEGMDANATRYSIQLQIKDLLKRLPQDKVYQLRVICLDDKGNTLGNFSSELQILFGGNIGANFSTAKQLRFIGIE